MSFTREDVLRELELLPVWKLRTPLTKEFQQVAKAEVKTTIKTETQIESLPVALEENTYHCSISEDRKWAFIWLANTILSASQSTLFSNILVALKITKITQMRISNIEDFKVGVIVVMGEAAAQQVLNTTDSIETLRGKIHKLNTMPMIVTYHPRDILQNLQLKPKAWEDCCLAKGVLNT